jgi:hypothetical protein
MASKPFSLFAASYVVPKQMRGLKFLRQEYSNPLIFNSILFFEPTSYVYPVKCFAETSEADLTGELSAMS